MLCELHAGSTEDTLALALCKSILFLELTNILGMGHRYVLAESSTDFEVRRDLTDNLGSLVRMKNVHAYLMTNCSMEALIALQMLLVCVGY